MSGKTEIGWTDRVWNPTVGCTRVSAGCENCYAEKFANRLEGMGRAEYAGLTKKHADRSVNWTGVVRTLPERLEDPLRWKKPQRVFVNSMSDLFHEDVPREFIDQVFAAMGACEDQGLGHVFQILTKRAERMHTYMTSGYAHQAWNRRRLDRDAFPSRNVWLGVSVENQAAADERIPLLLETPAAVRFLSCEPLLGPVDLTRIDCTDRLWAMLHRVDGDRLWEYEGPSVHNALTGEWDDGEDAGRGGDRIAWVIAGGESGPGHRPMNLDWVRSIRDQCLAAGVPFFFKQVGGVTPKAGGRLLDGREWNEFPDTKGA